MARCRSCGAKIVWAATVTRHRNIPLDADPVRTVGPGELRIARTAEDGKPVVAYVPAGDLYVSHFATCPNAAEHRRK